MATFVLIHGAGDGGWYWHLVERELRARGHEVVAPDLPALDLPADADPPEEGETAGLAEFTATAVDAVTATLGEAPPRPLLVAGQSYGGFTAPLVADRLGADVLVFVAGMVPAPGEAPDAWWENTGYGPAVAQARAQDGGLTDNGDPMVSFFNGVPRELAEDALAHERNHPPGGVPEPWPLASLPAIPTKFVLCTEDRFLPPAFARRVVADRLPGVVPDELAGGHCPALSRPQELADLFETYVKTL